MTLLFTSVLQNLIVMTVDSTLTEYGNPSPTFRPINKIFRFDNNACLSAWGDGKAYNFIHNIRHHIEKEIETAKGVGRCFTVDDLASYIDYQLRNKLSPHEQSDDFEEFGFHVAGFDQHNSARLYHIFWGCPRPNPAKEVANYHFQPEHERKCDLLMLYNGRNDLVDLPIQNFFTELNRYNSEGLQFEIDLSKLGELIIHYAIEVLKAQGGLAEVGFPLKSLIIKPNESVSNYPNIFRAGQDLEYLEIGKMWTSHDILIPISGSQFLTINPISAFIHSAYYAGTLNARDFASPGTIHRQNFNRLDYSSDLTGD